MYKRKIVSMIVVALCVVAATSAALAQGRYANVYSRGDVDGFIQSLETSSDIFSRDFKSTGGISTTERRIVDRFENAVDRLRARFNSNNNNWWQSRIEVQSIMTEARQVNVMMNNDRYGRPLERQWRNLRRDINKLADTYELQALPGGGGGGGGVGYPPVGGGNVPSWAIGTFFGRDQRTGSGIFLTIERSGSVAVSVDGNSPAYASLSGTTMTNGPYVSRLSRINNGFRTTDVTNGSYIDYRRTTVGENPGQGGVPAWAAGTFYGRNPQTGGTITLDINANGSVSVSMDGAAPTYASINGTTMTNGPYVSRLSRINNGIRTTDVTNNSYIDYYRTPIGGNPGNPGQGSIPTWATGTFYGQNPQTGGTIILTVQRNGTVTISFDGASAVYASMNGTTLTNGPYVSRVTRLTNGIRTTDVSNGSFIDYYRR